MAKETRATIAAFFETGDVPTESQFQSLFDSVPFFDNTGTSSAAGADAAGQAAKDRQGLVVTARDADAKSGTNTPQISGVTTVTKPSQLPTVEQTILDDQNPGETSFSAGTDESGITDAEQAVLDAVGLTLESEPTIVIDTDSSTSTRNRFGARLSNAVLRLLWKYAKVANPDGTPNAGDSVIVYTGADAYSYKRVVAGSNVTVTPSDSALTIAASNPGETNTTSNVGSAAGVFKQKTGVDFELRSMAATADSNVTVTQSTNTVDFATSKELYASATDSASAVASFSSSTNSGKYQTITALPITLATNQNLSIDIGTRLRLRKESTSVWIEGIVTAISGTPTDTVTIETDRCSGAFTSGAETVWDVFLADGIAGEAFNSGSVDPVADILVEQTISYKKNTDGEVVFKGILDLVAVPATNTASAFFNLPTGYRPFVNTRYFAVPVTTGTDPLFGRVTITTGGDMSLTLLGTPGDYSGLDLSLDQVRFNLD